jgi:hypothetical protein
MVVPKTASCVGQRPYKADYSSHIDSSTVNDQECQAVTGMTNALLEQIRIRRFSRRRFYDVHVRCGSRYETLIPSFPNDPPLSRLPSPPDDGDPSLLPLKSRGKSIYIRRAQGLKKHSGRLSFSFLPSHPL